MDIEVIVTGKNWEIAEEICDHLKADKGIEPRNLVLNRKSLYDIAVRNAPHLVIICMDNESEEDIKLYDMLSDFERMGLTTIMVVADSYDKKMFMQSTGLSRMFFLSKPVIMSLIYSKVDEVKKTIDDDKFSTLLPNYVEYINPNPIDGFLRKHVLIVDDDQEQLIVMKDQLKEFFDVTVVTSAPAALSYLECFKVDIILLDLVMPGVDGSKVLEKVRENKVLNKVPVILMATATEMKFAKKLMIDLAPQGTMVKPMRKSALITKIIDIFDENQAQ